MEGQLFRYQNSDCFTSLLAVHFCFVQKSPAKKPERKRKKKVNPSPKELAKLDVLHQHTQVKLQELQEEHASVTSKKVQKKSKSKKVKTNN